MANSVDPDQTAPVRVYSGMDHKILMIHGSGSTLFASILKSSVMLDKYMQQTCSADDIFRGIFLGALRALTLCIRAFLCRLLIFQNRLFQE